MSLQALKEQVANLSINDRLALASAILQSLQDVPTIDRWQYLVARPLRA